MREVKHLVVTFAEIIIVVVLAIFAVGNIRPATYNFAGTTFAGNVWWTVAGSALLGFLFALLLFGASRSVAGLRGRGVRRQNEQSAQELTTLQREYQRLRGEYAQAATERDHYRSMLASAAPANQSVTSTTTETVADGAPQSQRVGETTETTETTEQVATDTQPDQPAVTRESGWPNPFRVRRTDRNPDETQMPNGTPAPTA